MADTRLDVPVVTIDGRQLPADRHRDLTRVRIEESIMLPDSFALHFDDPYFSIYDSGTFAIGAVVEVGMEVDGEPVVITSGEVTALAVEPSSVTGRHELVVSGYDLTHRLARTSRRRTFQSMTDGDIVAQIASEHSLQQQVTLPGGGVMNDYLLQAGESDLALLQRLAERNGADVWVAADTLHVEPRRGNTGSDTVRLRWGDNLLHFRVRLSAREATDSVVVRGWDPQRKEAIVAESTSVEAPARAARAIVDQARSAFGATSRTSPWIEVPDSGVATTLAESLHSRAASETVVLRGEAVGDPWLGAGATVELEGVGETLADTYRVTGVTHLYGAGAPYRTRFVCGGLERAELADLVGRDSSGSVTHSPLASLMVGEVTDTADPEHLGRVRVRLPNLDDAAESTWARVILPGAGPETGVTWLPAVNDEVVVGFELGDATRPFVLGGVWSQPNPPSSVLVVDREESRRPGLRSGGGHLLAFDDTDAHVELSAADGGAALRLADAESQLEGGQRLVIKAGSIKIEADQALELSGARITITGNSDVSISGHPIKLN